MDIRRPVATRREDRRKTAGWQSCTNRREPHTTRRIGKHLPGKLLLARAVERNMLVIKGQFPSSKLILGTIGASSVKLALSELTLYPVIYNTGHDSVAKERNGEGIFT